LIIRVRKGFDYILIQFEQKSSTLEEGALKP